MNFKYLILNSGFLAMIASASVLWLPHLCEAEVGDRGADELVTTRPHRFWVTNRDANNDGISGDWIEAEELRVGDRFLLADGGEAVLKGTESIRHLSEPSRTDPSAQPSTSNFQPVTTFNFEVADTHTYFVGSTGVWVHNDCDVSDMPIRLLDVGSSTGVQSGYIIDFVYDQIQKHLPGRKLEVILSEVETGHSSRMLEFALRYVLDQKLDDISIRLEYGKPVADLVHTDIGSVDIATVSFPRAGDVQSILQPIPDLLKRPGIISMTLDLSVNPGFALRDLRDVGLGPRIVQAAEPRYRIAPPGAMVPEITYYGFKLAKSPSEIAFQKRLRALFFDDPNYDVIYAPEIP